MNVYSVGKTILASLRTPRPYYEIENTSIRFAGIIVATFH